VAEERAMVTLRCCHPALAALPPCRCREAAAAAARAAHAICTASRARRRRRRPTARRASQHAALAVCHVSRRVIRQDLGRDPQSLLSGYAPVVTIELVD
jgi:hypothetical protein